MYEDGSTIEPINETTDGLFANFSQEISKNITENATNTTPDPYTVDGWHWDDASWILCASFVIFTMQTGN